MALDEGRGASTLSDSMETRRRSTRDHLQLVPPVEARAPDEAVRRAVELMKGDLAAAWTVTSLARRVGLSRPVFARRFRESEGVSPGRYLAALRLDEAARLLRVTDDGLAGVASRVGYASEFAFNRAFKRHHGQAPGVYRRGARTSGPMEFRAAA